jgi:hypothetical protein
MSRLQYSPYFASADFRLFPEFKKVLKGKCFQEAEDMSESVKKEIDINSLLRI